MKANVYNTENGETTVQNVIWKECTKEDFKVVEDKFDELTLGVEFSAFCPEDLSKLSLYKNPIVDQQNYRSMFLQFSS
jgi:hypothetical protein